MDSYSKAPHDGLGSRRRGGPIEFKVLWPALRESLHEVYMANSEPDLLGATVAHEAVGAELEVLSVSLSKAA